MKIDTFLSDNTGLLPRRPMFVVVYDIKYNVTVVSWLQHSEL